MKYKNGMHRKGIIGYELEEGRVYSVRRRLSRMPWTNFRMKCLKNYRDYILFEKQNGIKECILKTELITTTVRKLKRKAV